MRNGIGFRRLLKHENHACTFLSQGHLFSNPLQEYEYGKMLYYLFKTFQMHMIFFCKDDDMTLILRKNKDEILI